MASTAFFDIQAALNAQLNTMTGHPPVAWANYNYEPTVGTLWARAVVLPATTSSATLGTAGTDEQIGVYAIDIFAPSGAGDGAGRLMADLIADRFKPVTELLYNGRMVRCVSVSIATARNEDNWFVVPVRVDYLSFTAKR